MGAKPLILALDTATAVARVALLRGAEPWLEREAAPGTHSARLLPAVEALFADAGVGLGDVEAFALAIGPGSFTGLRVGLATAKGFAFGSDRPLVPVSTLQALAAVEAGSATPALALLDARRGEFYAGLYRRPGDARESDAGDAVVAFDALAEGLPDRATLVAGEGAEEAARRLAGSREGLAVRPARASAIRVGRLAAARLAAAGRLEDFAAAERVPRYLRRAEAEVKRTGERFEGPR